MNLQIKSENGLTPKHCTKEMKNLQKSTDFEIHIADERGIQDIASGIISPAQNFNDLKYVNQQMSREPIFSRTESHRSIFDDDKNNIFDVEQKNFDWQDLLQQSNKLLKENFEILQQQQNQYGNTFTTGFEGNKQMQTSRSAQNFNEKNKSTASGDIANFMDVVRSQNEIVIPESINSLNISNISKDLEAISETTKIDEKISGITLGHNDMYRLPLTRATTNPFLRSERKGNESICHQQYSSSTDEGIETDIEDSPGSGKSSNAIVNQQRLNSNLTVGVHQKSLSQHINSHCHSPSHSPCLKNTLSAFESSLDYQFDSELASSLPSCTSSNTIKYSTDNPVVSKNMMHSSLFTSSMKPFHRPNPITGNRNLTRSPIDFREGRRASDGLVPQQQVDIPQEINSNLTVFNHQKLNDMGKTKGAMELHLVQREHEVLKNKYQTPSQEEQCVRQIQHSQYHQVSLPEQYLDENSSRKQVPKKIVLPETLMTANQFNPNPSQKNEFLNLSDLVVSSPSSMNASVQQNAHLGKTPLQQQLMQHRLLQQKRHLLQKQGAFQQGKRFYTFFISHHPRSRINKM